MAMHDEIKEQKKKTKYMTGRERWKNYWYYYKIHTIAAVFGTIILVTLVKDILMNNQKSVFEVAIVNSESASLDEAYNEEFAAYLGLDPKKEKVFLDNSFQINLAGADQMTVATSQKMMALVQVGQLDAMIAPKDMLDHYSGNGFIGNLKDYLPPQLFQQLEARDKIYYTSLETENGTEILPAAIKVGDSEKLQEMNLYYTEEPLLSFITSTTHPDNVLKFIEYLYSEN